MIGTSPAPSSTPKPSVRLNSAFAPALISGKLVLAMNLFHFEPLTDGDIMLLLKRAVQDERGLAQFCLIPALPERGG